MATWILMKKNTCYKSAKNNACTYLISGRTACSIIIWARPLKVLIRTIPGVMFGLGLQGSEL